MVIVETPHSGVVLASPQATISFRAEDSLRKIGSIYSKTVLIGYFSRFIKRLYRRRPPLHGKSLGVVHVKGLLFQSDCFFKQIEV